MGMRSRLLFAALLLAAAACPQRELDVKPFRIAIVGPDGAPLAPASPARVVCTGMGTRVDATTFTVASAGGDCPAGINTVHFEPVASQVTVPDFADGGEITVLADYDPAALGADGAPLPWRVLRLAQGPAGIERYRLLIGEGDLRLDQGLPFIRVGPLAEATDLPSLEVVASSLYLEPSRCGDLYRDRMRASSSSGNIVLDAGELGSIAIPGAEDLPDWQVLHVQSWHRAAGDTTSADCKDRLRTWTQAAAFR